MAWQLDLWRWRLVGTDAGGKEWPAWPGCRGLAGLRGPGHLDTVALAQNRLPAPSGTATRGCHCGSRWYRWRHHQHSTGRPGFAAGPARHGHAGSFALPTLSRAVAALIDWFTLAVFQHLHLGHLDHLDRHADRCTGQACGQRGQLAPGSAHRSAVRTAGGAGSLGGVVQFGVVACIARPCPIWKSLVLPASGATPGWLPLLTLWLPLLNYARSYALQVQNVVRLMNNAPLLAA